MTFSILAYDAKTGSCGGAATTGSLCVGGWVLRGSARAGMTASQGTAPSTLWGEDALALMQKGMSAAQAIATVTGDDAGRAHRQLAALDLTGGTAAFTGEDSLPVCDALEAHHVVVAGNMLANRDVLPATLDAFRGAEGPLGTRLRQALRAGDAAGGDSRGLLSAALLIVSPDTPPLSLRIDHDPDPLGALDRLYDLAHGEPYHGWTKVVPVLNDPQRSPVGVGQESSA